MKLTFVSDQAAGQGKVADPNITKYSVKVLPVSLGSYFIYFSFVLFNALLFSMIDIYHGLLVFQYAVVDCIMLDLSLHCRYKF